MKKQLFKLALAILTSQINNAQTVSSFAGSGNTGSTDATGTAASFNIPYGVAVDASDNVYVVDTGNHKIRKISPTGIVSTFAGSGSQGSIDAAGTAASFYYPTGVALDASDNVYVADQSNHTIRKITPAGAVSTFAGSGNTGNTNATGTAASFNRPAGIAVDASGNVYVADQGNHKIRKITSAGVVSTFAGSGSQGSIDATGTAASFYHPTGVALDASGNLYVADQFNHRIRKITPAGVVSTLAGSGTDGNTDATGTAASFSYPIGVAVDASGNVYVGDQNNNKVRKITPAGVVSTLAGSGVAGNIDAVGLAASFNYPSGVAVDASGNVYVADYSNNKIRKIGSTLSTEDFDAKNPITIYPNPVKEVLNVAVENLKQIEIFTLLGQKVASSNQSFIETAGLQLGTYIVMITDTNNNNKSIKIVKE
ncbi:T9SS type A sorting domain-containing protein [Flavobacterium limi]|uniref:Secretion system C-terminal sorting domain-containing protein n=1 Tax=Flavobacterium limi TaxID=2045105 RepID=A0ABQ1UQ11_9FLAO|nr:T9SS type A sorting domain-containing protein [Flavobacterium limi]GGF24325.1 hypothetical protein GCM10011518_37090 [Flavobacterium limi]